MILVARAAVPDVSCVPDAFTPGKFILAVPSNDTPPIVLALAKAVEVADKATAIFAVPSKDVPPMVLAVANAVAVAALPVVLPELPDVLPVTSPVTLPSKLATIVPAVHENTSELFVASGIKVNFPAESS